MYSDPMVALEAGTKPETPGAAAKQGMFQQRGVDPRKMTGVYPAWWTNIAMENGHRNSGFSH